VAHHIHYHYFFHNDSIILSYFSFLLIHFGTFTASISFSSPLSFLSGKISPYFGFGEVFADGSIKNDLPMKQLAETWNVNYFIVSQCNPHIVPFFFHHRGASGNPLRSAIESKS
jgi:hypothetical protein